MKLFLVGATGRTGKWILNEALNQGHHVTALVREPTDRISLTDPKLNIISGSLNDLENLTDIISGHTAIISSLNSASVQEGTEKLIASAIKANVTRFLGIAGAGILQLDEKNLRRDRPNYPKLFLKTSEEHLHAWRMLEASTLNWTLLCTPDLIDAAATGGVLFKEDYLPTGGNRIPTGDVARFLINEIENSSFYRKRIGLTV